uniref:Uncharacterized protein n=1 Tax=Arundo donax TaxID=35708 RepID=A0A0A9ANV8_ARUDO
MLGFISSLPQLVWD